MDAAIGNEGRVRDVVHHYFRILMGHSLNTNFGNDDWIGRGSFAFVSPEYLH